jgi:hypothetical protein
MLLLAHLLHSMHREPVERHTGTAALRSRSLGAPLQTHDSGRKHAFLDTNATAPVLTVLAALQRCACTRDVTAVPGMSTTAGHIPCPLKSTHNSWQATKPQTLKVPNP